jgi:hypothetical protein
VENLDAILTACPDIDLVWFGSLDCRVSMNLPSNMGLGGTEPEWLETVELFEKTMKKHDKPLGGFAFAAAPFGTPEGVRKAAQKMSFMCITADVLHLMSLGKDLEMARELTALPTAAEKKDDEIALPTKAAAAVAPVATNGEHATNGINGTS